MRVAGPIVVSQLGGVAMSATDVIMVGPLGAHALAAGRHRRIESRIGRI